MLYFNEETMGIHDSEREESLPPGLFEITPAQRLQILTAIADGKIVSVSDGGLLIGDAQPIALSAEVVERRRLFAYADPASGSDRYFAEAQRESLLGNADAAEAAKALGLARFAEIQAENPWPAE